MSIADHLFAMRFIVVLGLRINFHFSHEGVTFDIVIDEVLQNETYVSCQLDASKPELSMQADFSLQSPLLPNLAHHALLVKFVQFREFLQPPVAYYKRCCCS